MTVLDVFRLDGKVASKGDGGEQQHRPDLRPGFIRHRSSRNLRRQSPQRVGGDGILNLWRVLPKEQEV